MARTRAAVVLGVHERKAEEPVWPACDKASDATICQPVVGMGSREDHAAQDAGTVAAPQVAVDRRGRVPRAGQAVARGRRGNGSR